MSDAAASDAAASRLDKLRKIEALGLDPWGGRFDGHTAVADVLAKPCLSFDENPTETARVAGRVVLRRDMGNAHFLQVRDHTGTVQVWIGKKQVGDANWQLAQLFDLGDLIGVDGVFGKTKRRRTDGLRHGPDVPGQVARAAPRQVSRDAGHRVPPAAPLPRPDLHAGDARTHQAADQDRPHHPPPPRRTGFCEVETPTLHAIAGGAAARPFITHHNALDIELFLRIALELHLKRLLVGGIEKVYEIGRVFRNEGISRRHNPEFTMLELYQAYGDYRTMMDLTEGLIVACVDALGGGRVRPYGDKTVDFTPPWQRAKYGELFREHVGCDMSDPAAVLEAAAKFHVPTANKEHDVVVHHLFEACVEDKLVGPVFVHDYPAALCPLTKRKRGNADIAERFELYVRGMELANAYTELNDPVTQEATFRRQLAGLPEDDSMAKMDDDFVRALRHGMPPAGGLGIGIDRLVMLLTNTQTIRDVILFPLLRPERRSYER